MAELDVLRSQLESSTSSCVDSQVRKRMEEVKIEEYEKMGGKEGR